MEIELLRRLQSKDAPLMLEWMHDSDVTSGLKKNFAKMTIKDCETFIQYSCDGSDINLAVTNDEDVYQGTVSLKHIMDGTAEFAIVMRKEAMGKGYAKEGMAAILKKSDSGFDSEMACYPVRVDAGDKRYIIYDGNGMGRDGIGYAEEIISGEH